MNANNAIQFLEQLVTIPSLSGQEQAVAHFLVTQMSHLGFEAHIDAAGNAVGSRTFPDVHGHINREMILLGHMDTVPGEIAVRHENGRLYGRGTVDAKGPLATFIQAAAQATPQPGTRLIVIGAVEEESATSKGAHHAATQYTPTACIIGEPSGWDSVTLGYKGRILFDYCYQQAMGHTAGPNASVAEMAITWWNRVNDYANKYNSDQTTLFTQLMPSLRHIHTSSDGLTNQVEAKVGVRLPPNFPIAPFIEQLSQWAGNAQLHPHAYEPAYQSTRRTPLARTFNRVLRAHGQTPRFKHKTGTADMNVVGPIWNCPIVAYGPGDSQLDHTPNEHILIHDYLHAIDILTNVLEAPTW